MSAFDHDDVSVARTLGHLLGISSGWDEAETWLMEQAGEAFKNGKDEKATLMRTLAKQAKQTSLIRRDYYDKTVREIEANAKDEDKDT